MEWPAHLPLVGGGGVSLNMQYAMYEKLFSKQNFFVFENSLENLQYQNLLDKPPI